MSTPYLQRGLPPIDKYLDAAVARLVPMPEELSTAERMEELLASLAREAVAEAVPENAERYAAAILFINTGLQSLSRLRGK